MDVLARPRAAAAAAFGGATAARGKRIFHPRGRAFTGTVVVSGGCWGARVLDEPATHQVVARVSRALGLPSPIPDIAGLAIRFPDLGSSAGPLDVLLATTGGPPGLRHLLLPEPIGRTFSSVLPYRTGTGRRLLLGARRSSDATWELLAAPIHGRWEPWGSMTLRSALPEQRSVELRYLPTLGAPDLQPVKLFRAMRHKSYRQSQAHRP